MQSLRIECKKLMVEKELDRPGCLETLADILNANKNSLSMALTGYRSGPSSIALLEQLKDHLTGTAN